MLKTAKNLITEILENPIPFVIGGVINSFWFTIFPYIFTLGYIDRLMYARSYGITTLPKWNNIKDLVIRGFKLLSIILIYLAPPFILVALGQKSNYQFGTAPTFTPISIIGVISFIILSFLLIGGLASYVKRERLVDAFNIREIIFAMVTYPKEYLTIWIWLTIVNFFSLFVIIVPIIGIFIFGFVNFYVMMVGFVSIIEKLGGVNFEKSQGLQSQEEYYY